MTTIFEALADHYQVPESELEAIRSSHQRTQRTKELMAQPTPSKRQNKARSGRAGRKAHNKHKDLAAVGGMAIPRWNALAPATLPADYKMCKVKEDM